MSKKIAIIQFPGTNCEYDVLKVLDYLGALPEIVWHNQNSLRGFDAVILPGGFAHGDYLRPGAIARFSPIMQEVISFASQGGFVLGICNGFQILTEAHLLPGALQKNLGLKFLCKDVTLNITSYNSFLTSYLTNEKLVLPINHFEGSYVCDKNTLKQLETYDQILFTYQENLNGSVQAIAGICNKDRNVIGLMPHPERACNSYTGKTDGLLLFKSFLESI